MGMLRIKWPDGTKEDLNTDLTVAGLINERFGDGYDEFVAKGGAIIEPTESGTFAEDKDDGAKVDPTTLPPFVNPTADPKCGPPDAEDDGPNYSKADQQVIDDEAAAEVAYQKTQDKS